MKKVYIETYGCQMNEYDTEIVKTILAGHQFGFTEVPEEAEVIFLNTCSVRENAHQKVQNRIANLKHLKRRNKKLIMGVLGCMAQNLRDELLGDNVGVDIIAGPDSYKKLPELIRHVEDSGEKDFALTLSEFETYSDVFPRAEAGINAWVAVMRGCDNFCTFCVVPYTRGRERSRDPFNVQDEVRQLAGQGFKQVTLLGQNVNSYRSGEYDFGRLMKLVSEVDGIERIRFTSPHPKDFPENLLQEMAGNPKICKHIHLPLQAGSDRVLQVMNRTYTRREFENLAAHIRQLIPGVVLTTDIIVGFPGETDAEFEETLQVIRELQFDSAFMFKYSERKQTIASRKYPDDVPEEVKSERLDRLIELQRLISLLKNEAHIGQKYKVLVEGPGRKTGQVIGRTDGNKAVAFFSDKLLPGDFAEVAIQAASANTLMGELL